MELKGQLREKSETKEEEKKNNAGIPLDDEESVQELDQELHEVSGGACSSPNMSLPFIKK